MTLPCIPLPVYNAGMEFTVHKELKQLYCADVGETEVRMGRYRIDAVVDDVLYEIQVSSLSAIRDKIQKLTKNHRVVVVKPIVTRKRLVKLTRKNGKVAEERFSPKRQDILNIFDELVYFTRAFPNPNLELHVPLISVEETRFPGKGRRRRRRKGQFQIQDRRMIELESTHCFRSEQDLLKLLPKRLPPAFTTGLLAEAMDVQRHVAQRICYCLRKMNAITAVGKEGNAIVYAMEADAAIEPVIKSARTKRKAA